MTKTQSTTKTALWLPGWYELDQPLTLGTTERFWFFQLPPSELSNASSFDFVFFNELSAAANCQVRSAEVISISHPELGALQHINTDGLDYVFHPVEGPPLTVNAEEDPGAVAGDLELADWSITVMLDNVSEPITEPMNEST